MNIQDAENILISHFVKNDSVTNEQFTSLAPKKTPLLESEAAMTYALESWTVRNIVAKFIGANSDGKTIFTWVLVKPLILNKQTIEIDGGMAISISNAVNHFYQQIGNDDSFCNPLQIVQEDIDILLEIINMLAESQIGEEKEKKE